MPTWAFARGPTIRKESASNRRGSRFIELAPAFKYAGLFDVKGCRLRFLLSNKTLELSVVLCGYALQRRQISSPHRATLTGPMPFTWTRSSGVDGRSTTI